MKNDTEQMSFENTEADNGPVVCLGMTFKNDEVRREYFRNELRKKLPDLKKLDGYPIGTDEDILTLSDPPFYTACPNPWTNDYVNEWELEKREKFEIDGQEEYHREPFAADVSEGKNHPIYMGHAYHTKVPHRAIMRYILHYTNPGDIILDGFSGTGMTAVAANYCNDIREIQELNYNITNNNLVEENGKPISKVGKRNVLINDLSPIATFIASNYNRQFNSDDFRKELSTIINSLESDYGWMYETSHNSSKGKINYVIWSDVFLCQNCSHEVVFFDSAVDMDNNKVLDIFQCPSCGAELGKRKSDRLKETVSDMGTSKVITKSKIVPVLINYSFQGKRYNKKPDENDLQLLSKLNEEGTNNWFPIGGFPKGVNTEQPIRSHGFTNVHHLTSSRNNIILGAYFEKIQMSKFKDLGTFLLTSSLVNLSYLYRWRTSGKGGAMSGTYYVCSTPQENNPFNQLRRKLNDICNLNLVEGSAVVSTNSTTQLMAKENSVDYIFTDPPFGANIMYSELNFLWESWLKVFSNNIDEAIVNSVHSKTMVDYQQLMTKCFEEYYRVLKPGRWMTVEFSNSQASVWNAIQEAIQKAGFVIANVAALDKKQGSFKAVTSTTAVKQDLVISAYKPKQENIEKMKKEQNTEQSAWTFVNQHLKQLPVFIGVKGEAQVITERTPRILFDRMVAYHVQNGLPVPISSAEFQSGVSRRFPMRDGMAFLESQVAEYDKKRILVKDFAQMSLFVSDENSAIEWIRQQLLKKPQTRQDLHPNYIREIQHIAKHELLPELDDLLNQNFLRYDGDGIVPDQIASYLRKNYKDLRGLEASDPLLFDRAKNRWYVPDPNKQADLEKLREKSLLREFDSYIDELESNKKKLKQFRTEAIRAGFKKAYSEKDFEKIVKVGDRLPESVIQEDDKLLMYYDNACIRLGL